MLLIQRIITDWTKLSRGGEGAALRNAVPETLVVPDFDRVDRHYVIHEVRFTEGSHYQGEGRLRYLDTAPHVAILPLHLRLSRTLLIARFQWTYHEVGAPERESHAVFELRPGQWGQFRSNGRFGAETKSGREWEYRKVVINVAFGDAIAQDVFVASAPDVEQARMAVLR